MPNLSSTVAPSAVTAAIKNERKVFSPPYSSCCVFAVEARDSRRVEKATASLVIANDLEVEDTYNYGIH